MIEGTRAVSIVLGIVLSACLAYGQAGTGEISGAVRDSTGAALPGVRLTLTDRRTTYSREVVTTSNGSYVAAALGAGEYAIKAELTNFRTQIREGIVLQVGRQERVDLVLAVGDQSEVVTVQDSVSLVNSSNAELSEVIGTERIVNLPLNGRQFVDLTLLSANVFKAPRGTRGSALAQTGAAVLVGGQRAGHNMYYLDGVSVTDQYFNHLVAAPPVDAIQEFNIQKSIYAAEFGGKASATISAVIKAGGKAVHGTAYEFLRNDILDARNFFDSGKKPAYRHNQFGGAIGGPIRKDQTFFFVSYERLRARQGLTQTFSVPRPAARAGDFSGLAAIYDPLTTTPSGSRTVFPGNRIATNRLDPVAIAFLGKMPEANLVGEAQNFLASPTLRNDDDQGVMRIDHRLTSKDNLFGRLYVADFDTFQPLGSGLLNESLVPGFGYYLTTHTKSIGLGETHVFSAGAVSEFRFGFLRVTGGQQSQNQGVHFAALNGVGGISPSADQTGYPSVSFSGAYSTAGDPANLFTRRNNSFDVLENVSLIRGPHSLKFGAYIFRLQFNPSESPNARGSFTFTPRYSSSAAGLGDGNAFADFLLGYPSSAQAGVGPGGSEYGRSTWSHFYAQDDWRIRRSLMFNFGVRYEINGKITDTQNRLSSIETDRFVIASDDEGRVNAFAGGLLGLIPGRYVTSKEAGYERSLQRPNYHHIAPRAGMAWEVSDKTVIRAGWGLFFNQAAYNIQTALTENLPFFFNKSVNTAVTTLTPSLTTSTILSASGNGTSGGSSLDYAYRSEFADSWSFNLQRKLGREWALEVGYFGSHVTGADNSTYRNIPLPGPGAIDARRPNPLISAFKAIRWDGWSIYHSGTVKVERRLARGLSVNANYTWSKSIDDASDVGSTFAETNIPQDVRNVRAEKALSSFDHRHRVVFSFSYALPFSDRPGGLSHFDRPGGLSHFGNKLVKGWTVAALGSAQSGAPFTVTIPTDNANIGAGPSQRPNLVGDPNATAPRTAERWFDTSVFAMPSQFTFGSAGRNIVFGDNEVNVDLGLHKDTAVNDRARIQFRAEIFNLFNRTNFADVPGRIAFTPAFGRYSSALNSRQVQLALKLLF